MCCVVVFCALLSLLHVCGNARCDDNGDTNASDWVGGAVAVPASATSVVADVHYTIHTVVAHIEATVIISIVAVDNAPSMIAVPSTEAVCGCHGCSQSTHVR
jgi:hypothetical protein